MLCPSQIGNSLPLSTSDSKAYIPVCDHGRFKIKDKHLSYLKTKSWKQTLPVFPSPTLLTYFHGLLQNSTTKLTVKNDRCINGSHAKGQGPFWTVWHWFPSRWTLAFDIFVVAWVFVSYFCFGSVKDQFCGPTEPQTGSNTHLWHFKMELATAWHWKRIFHLQCLDFPMCAQIQLVKPKYTYHPYCYSVATEP